MSGNFPLSLHICYGHLQLFVTLSRLFTKGQVGSLVSLLLLLLSFHRPDNLLDLGIVRVDTRQRLEDLIEELWVSDLWPTF